MPDRYIDSPIIGERIIEARNRLGMSQESFAALTGFANRQTLQAVEKGNRRLLASELAHIVEGTGLGFDFFTDPLLWTGSGTFSYRCTSVDGDTLDRFEVIAGGWVNLWRRCNDFVSSNSKPCPEFPLEYSNSFEDVWDIAERIRQWFALGDTPACLLSSKIEIELGIPVLFVDMPEQISGAAFRQQNERLLFVNLRDSPARRNYDLAHELFHVLTWSSQQPERLDRIDASDKVMARKQQRFEQFAENFAAALLMPRDTMLKRWEKAAEMTSPSARAEILRHIRNEAQVSSQAVLWRLVNLRLLAPQEKTIIEQDLVKLDKMLPPPEYPKALPLSQLYLERLADALMKGTVSVRRAAGILCMEIDDLADAFVAHGMAVPFDI